MTHNTFEQLILQQIELNAQNLMMLPSNFWPKYHNSLSHKFYDPKRDVMNHRYFASETFKENILKTPLTTYSQHAVFSKSEKWDLIKKNPLSILQFNLEECSKTMIDFCLEQEPRLLSVLDQSVQTEERVKNALTSNGLVLGFIKADFKTYKNCKIAVKQNIYAIQYVPEDLLDEFFVDLLLNSNEWLLPVIPRPFACKENIQDHYFEKDALKALIDYLEIYALEDNKEAVYSYLEVIRKKELQKDLFKGLSSSFYLSNGFNVPLIHFMLNEDVNIIKFFDFEQLDQVHFKNAINNGMIFDKLPTDVWQFILPSLIDNNTEQLFFLPESLKGMISSVHTNILNYCLDVVRQNADYTIPNYLFSEIAYKGVLDEKIIQFSDLRIVCNILVNDNIDSVGELEKINGENTTLFEIELLKEKLNPSLIGGLFKKCLIWYPLLSIKSVEDSILFAQAFPNEQSYLSDEIKTNSDFITAIRATNPEFFD